jgi:hypothetical protein
MNQSITDSNGQTPVNPPADGRESKTYVSEHYRLICCHLFKTLQSQVMFYAVTINITLFRTIKKLRRIRNRCQICTHSDRRSVSINLYLSNHTRFYGTSVYPSTSYSTLERQLRAARNGRDASRGHALPEIFTSGFSSRQQFMSCSRIHSQMRPQYWYNRY